MKTEKLKISLVGTSGNAFAVLSKCQVTMERAGLEKEEIEKFMDEAESGDYNHLLGTVMKYFDVS